MKITPEANMRRYGLGETVGWVEIELDSITIFPFNCDPLDPMAGMILEPDTAPVFRLIARELEKQARLLGAGGE